MLILFYSLESKSVLLLMSMIWILLIPMSELSSQLVLAVGVQKESISVNNQQIIPINSNASSTPTLPFYVENTKSSNIEVMSINPFPEVKVTYKGNSSIDGSPTQTIGTIIDTMDQDGAVHSKGQAIILTAFGEIITYRSESVGYYDSYGSFSDSGVILFSLPFNNSAGNKSDIIKNSDGDIYSKFNNAVGIYKKKVDPQGNGLTTVWKWG